MRNEFYGQPVEEPKPSWKERVKSVFNKSENFNDGEKKEEAVSVELSISEKRALLNLFREKSEVTPEVVGAFKKATGIEEIASLEIDSDNESRLKGIELELTLGNKVTVQELLKKIFLNTNNPEKWYEKAMDKFGYMSVRNIEIPKLKRIGKINSTFRTQETGQRLHHDGIMDYNHSSALYQGEIKDGELPRQADTELIDAQDFYEGSEEFFTKWYLNTSESDSLPSSLKKFREKIGVILQNPKNHKIGQGWGTQGVADLYNKKITEGSLNNDSPDAHIAWAQMMELGTGSPEINGDEIIQMQKDLQEHLKSKIHHFEWKANSLLIFNDKDVVHARGFRKDSDSVSKERPLAGFEVSDAIKGKYE